MVVDPTGETDDGFGPGADLVLSFVGVIILLIGIVAAIGLPGGGSVTKAELDKALAQVAALDAERLRLEQENKALRERDSGDGSVPEPNSTRRALAFRFNGTSTAFFLQGSSDLREPARLLLDHSRYAIARRILEADANEIEIVGFASPEPSGSRTHDTNLDLSTARAEAVAHYFARLGVPYECMSVRGVGRGRSETLYDIYLSRRPKARIQDWDALFSSRDANPGEALAKAFAEERRVDVLAVHDAESKCTRQKLLAAFGV